VVQFNKKLNELENKTEEITQVSEQENPPKNQPEGSPLVLVEESEKSLLVPKKVPNFLALRPDLKDIYGINDLSTPEKRFQLIGGVRGFITTAKKVDSVDLNIKTFSQMLHCIEVRIILVAHNG